MVCHVKDGNYGEGDSNLASLLTLGTAAAAALDEAPQTYSSSQLYSALPSEQSSQSCACTTLNFLDVALRFA